MKVRLPNRNVLLVIERDQRQLRHWRNRRLYSTSGRAIPTLSPVRAITSRLNDVNIEQFRDIAFIPQLPLLIKSKKICSILPTSVDIPAAIKWFPRCEAERRGNSSDPGPKPIATTYLLPFSSVIVPYEILLDRGNNDRGRQTGSIDDHAHIMSDALSSIVKLLGELQPGTFHAFKGPLGLFLESCKFDVAQPSLRRLYIAQAQVSDFPIKLQDDLPTPKIVKEAGKGDIYDANLWMGWPPTDTPLHKDPNPNLFVQLAGSKRIRLFTPVAGTAIFHYVQQRTGHHSPGTFRGKEMMEGLERAMLDNVVWNQHLTSDGLETVLDAGDALFIPRGWWHSVRSRGVDLTASVNWWFR